MATISSLDDILTNAGTMDQFCEWFWKGNINDTKNIDSLVKALNTSKYRLTSYVRIEKFRPCIYSVALKYMYHEDWQFVKIGFTHVDTSNDASRMTKIEEDINQVYGKDKACTVFVLPIDPVDIRTHTDVEKTTRNKLGIPVQKELANKLSFPVHTEWVMTTTAFNDKIIKEKEKATKERNAHTGLLKFKFVQKIPLPSSLTPPKNINNGETVQICKKNGEICLQESSTSDSPEVSGKLEKELKGAKKKKTSLQESGTSDSPEVSRKQAKELKGEKKEKTSLQESGTRDSTEASGRQTKDLTETKKETKKQRKKSGTDEIPGTSGQQAKASKRNEKGENPKI